MWRTPHQRKAQRVCQTKSRELWRKNLSGKHLSEYYPGSAHLGFWSAEMLCLRIAKIAAGKMCLFKLVYTDSDCVVRENINIFPIWGGGGGGG